MDVSEIKRIATRQASSRAYDMAQARIDLTAALRSAARLGLSEGVCNHFSLEVPGQPDKFLINPQGLHWSEITPGDLMVVDSNGAIVEGSHAVEPTAFFIHSWIHRLNAHARCVLHTHMPYATALTLVDGGRLEWCNQNTLRFWNRVGYDDEYRGLALDESEGRRIAGALKGNDVLFSASHGVTVVAASVAWAFDDDTVERAAEIMSERQVRRLPVVDRNKRLVGIVSLGDFAVDGSEIEPAADALSEISRPS